MQDISKQVFDFQNEVRTNPKILIPILEERLKYYKDNILSLPGQQALITKEGPAVVEETIEFLIKQEPVGPLKYEQMLELAARDHAIDIGTHGINGHEGTDKSKTKDRIERYGNWKPGSIGENISFGKSTAQDIIIQLVVDDGVPTRGHRTNLFNPNYQLVGIYTAEHKTYQYTTVLDYSKNFKDLNQAEEPGQQKEKKEKKEKQAKKQEEGEQQVQEKQPKEKKPLPEGVKSVKTKTRTVTKHGKKHITTTKTYTMQDGSTKEEVEETVEDA